MSERGNPRFLALGTVRRPHGVRGDLFLELFTDHPERIAALQTVFLASNAEGANAQTFTVSGASQHRNGLILRLEELRNRDQADPFRRWWVLVPIEEAIPLEQDEFYLFELVGLKVVTTAGEVLGLVTDVIETGANDVYVVQGGERGEVLIPAVPHVVLQIDFAAEHMLVEPPDGLLE